MKPFQVAEKADESHKHLSQRLSLAGVESLTLIGKHPKQRLRKEEWIERVLDLDYHVFVPDPMTPEKLAAVSDVFESLRNSSVDNVDVQFAIADGPLKPMTEKEYDIFFHVLLHTPEAYRKSPLRLCKNSWQYDTPVFGKSPG